MKILAFLRRYGGILLLLVLGVEYLFFSSVGASKELKLKSLMEQTDSLKAKVKLAQTNLDNGKNSLVRLGLNKFRMASKKNQQQQIIEDISILVNNLQIQHITLQAEPAKETDGYYKHSFSMEVRSKFSEIVQLVNNLENKLNLTISDFNLEQDKDATDLHVAKFIISSIYLKSNSILFAEDITPASQLIAETKYSEITTDPFLNPYPKLSSEAEEVIAQKSIKSLSLTGIIDFMGRKSAVIDKKVVRKGDSFNEYRVESIGDNSVILIDGTKKLQLMLKELVPTKVQELKKFSTDAS